METLIVALSSHYGKPPSPLSNTRAALSSHAGPGRLSPDAAAPAISAAAALQHPRRPLLTRRTRDPRPKPLLQPVASPPLSNTRAALSSHAGPARPSPKATAPATRAALQPLLLPQNLGRCCVNPSPLSRRAVASVSSQPADVTIVAASSRHGSYNFEGRYDLVKLIKLVAEQGLYLHLRIGPYVCAEWNFGCPYFQCIAPQQICS